MKSKLWHTKNNYTAKTFCEKENIQSKDTFMLGQRATLYTNLKQHHFSLTKNEAILTAKQSNVDQLKREIKCLENSQFLSMKYRCATETDHNQDVHYRVSGKEFMPSKKVTQLQKFKLHLRRKGKTRRISLLLDKKKFQQGRDYNCLNYLQIKDINCQGKETSCSLKQHNLKKKETPSIVKKYYRPQTSKNRSVQQLTIKQNEVRGRSLKSSATNRTQNQNVLIYCY